MIHNDAVASIVIEV